MIVTDEQRRWWFATHPEFSWSNRGGGGHGHGNEEGPAPGSPESVDAYVDEQLKYASGPLVTLLTSFKREFGTQGESEAPTWDAEAKAGLDGHKGALTYDKGFDDGMKWLFIPNRGPAPPLALNPDYIAGFYAGVDKATRQFKSGYIDGKWYIEQSNRSLRIFVHTPDLSGQEDSPYAYGVRAGIAAALDEEEAWRQKWIEPLLTFLGIRNSRRIRRKLTERYGPPPPGDFDGHHIAALTHWRAKPAQKVLENVGIGLEDVENLTWARRPYHQTLNNSKAYYNKVNRLLEGHTDREKVIEILDKIRQDILAERFLR